MQNELDHPRWGSQAKYIKSKCTELHPVNCLPKEVLSNRLRSFIIQIMYLVVDQKLRGLEAIGCKCVYKETIYWLPIRTVSIFT